MQICACLPLRALAALALLAMVQWATLNGQSLALIGGLRNQSPWLLAVQPDRAKYDELVRAVQLTDAPGQYNIVAVEEPWLNSNSASFFAAKQSLKGGARGYYTSLGYAQRDLAAALRRIEEFRTRYVITLAEPYQAAEPNFLNVISLPVLTQMRSDSRFAQIPFGSRMGVIVFRFHVSPAGEQEPDRKNDVLAPASDPRSIPEVISHITTERRGKSSLGWLNGKLPQQDSRGRVFVVRGGSLQSCLGWAFDDLNNSTPEEVWIEFTHATTGAHYYWRAIRSNRQELADELKLPSIRMAGFQCQEPGIRLLPGTYATRVYQSAGGTTIVGDLNTWEPAPFVLVP
jgi:hypothetical protein